MMFNWFKKDPFKERVLKRIDDSIKHTLDNAIEIHKKLIRIEEDNKKIMAYLQGEIRMRQELTGEKLNAFGASIVEIDAARVSALEALHQRLDSYAEGVKSVDSRLSETNKYLVELSSDPQVVESQKQIAALYTEYFGKPKVKKKGKKNV